MSKKLCSFFAVIAVLWMHQSAQALVDMKNANYSNTWIDLESPGAGYDLRVIRTYNSRSLYSGIFGFGWCSDFETSITVTAEGNLKLTECGAGQETFYFPREFSKKDIEVTVNKIMDALKAQKRGDDKSIKNLREDLLIKSDLRARFAFDLKIAIPVKEGTKFFANGQEVENIVFAKGYYTRSLPDGAAQRFSKEGRLTHLYDKNGNYLKFDYDKDLIKEIVDNNGRKLAFKYYNNKKVKTIVAPGNIMLEYKFSNLDNLASVKNGWGNNYNYDYDELHNLTKATYPDGTFIALTYDKKKDWVTGFQDRDKCNEKYTYEFSDKDPKAHYWSTVEKTCGKEVVNKSRHEFQYKTRADGQNYLYRVSSLVNSNSTEVTYHEVFGKPISIRRDGDLYSFEYFPNGQIRQKVSKTTVLTYAYDKESGKVSDVVTEIKNDKGKTVTTRKTNFKYDGKGNIVAAANTDGLKVELTYDGKGRVATIKDQARKLVKLEYEDRFGRPRVVTRPNVGSIKVSYKQNGEIDKVESPEGPTVATQVASTFSNYIEVISPATAEIYN